MLFQVSLLPFAAIAAQASALPAKRQSNSTSPPAPHSNLTDTDVLNFALTLEHLENTFYTTGLSNLSSDDFNKAGFSAAVRGFYQQVSQHEQSHVDNITTILGNQSVQAGVTNVTEFVQVSDMLETVGSSAYVGASVYLQSKTPLDLNQVFTLASSLIVSCPSNNTVIPVQANPQLTANPSTASPGQNVTLSYPGQPSNSTGLFTAFLNGIIPTFIPLNGSFTVEIPSTLRGFAYAVITNASSSANDSTTVAGPAFFNFAFDSNNTITPFNVSSSR
ncbi:ferritin-like domain-containing protein [Gloeopeniophorella convolvens]|nr:ferritin-like domain-containing protein [Gloeopeniophorella convolvens]